MILTVTIQLIQKLILITFYINREKNPTHAEQMLLCYCENVTKLASNLEFQHFRHNNISVEGDSVWDSEGETFALFDKGSSHIIIRLSEIQPPTQIFSFFILQSSELLSSFLEHCKEKHSSESTRQKWSFIFFHAVDVFDSASLTPLLNQSLFFFHISSLPQVTSITGWDTFVQYNVVPLLLWK